MKTIIAWILTGLASTSGLIVLMKRYGPKLFKGLTIARDALDLVDDVLSAVKPEPDGSIKITADEVKEFEALAAKLRRDLSK